METIKLKKDNILRFKIEDVNGNDTGNYLEFDLEDIELPLKLNKCVYEHNKNLKWISNQMMIIDKKQDKKQDSLLSSNEREKIVAVKEFYKREMNALDLFLGKNGTNKLLNGRKPFYSMYDYIIELIEPIMPKLQVSAEDIIQKVKEKYSDKKEENIIE